MFVGCSFGLRIFFLQYYLLWGDVGILLLVIENLLLHTFILFWFILVEYLKICSVGESQTVVFDSTGLCEIFVSHTMVCFVFFIYVGNLVQGRATVAQFLNLRARCKNNTYR